MIFTNCKDCINREDEFCSVNKEHLKTRYGSYECREFQPILFKTRAFNNALISFFMGISITNILILNIYLFSQGSFLLGHW